VNGRRSPSEPPGAWDILSIDHSRECPVLCPNNGESAFEYVHADDGTESHGYALLHLSFNPGPCYEMQKEAFYDYEK
jgi:hypothetical protein